METGDIHKKYAFENVEHFETIVRNIDGYIYSVIYEDENVVASYHSPQCEKVTGYSPDDYEQNPRLWIEMVHPDDRENVLRLFESRFRKTNQKHLEHRIILKDGSLRWISNRFTEQFDEKGEITRRDGFIVDITDRKNAEISLLEQNLFLQNLIDAIPNPIYYKNKKGVYLGCNNAFEKFVEKKKQDIINKTVFDVFPPGVSNLYNALDRKLFKRGGSQSEKVNLLLDDETTRHVIINNAVYYDINNAVSGLVGVIVDITKLQSTEEILQNTFRHIEELENIVNKSPAIVMLRRAEENYPVDFVSANISLFGYQAEEFIQSGMQFLDIVYHGDIERIKSDIEKFSSANTTEFTLEYRVIQKNGKVVWVDDHTWIRHDAAGKITHYHGIIIDISKRKEAIQSFLESVERYKTLAENSYDLIFEIGPELKFFYASPNFEQTLGYLPEEILQKNFREITHAEDLPGILQEVKKEHGQITHRLLHKNGDWLWFESTGKEYFMANGERRGVIVSRDITYRKQFEKQLIRNEKLIAIGEMSAMIAHESRNALTSIKLIMQLLQESKRLSVQEKKSLGVALQSIYHLESVIRQLLSFAQPMTIKPQKENINEVIGECISFLEIQAKKNDITISQKLDESIEPLKIHAPSFKECLINIFLNATQAFEGSEPKIRRRIVLSSEKVELRERLTNRDLNTGIEYFQVAGNTIPIQEINLEAGAKCALIQITDNGKGLSESYLKHIFEPFFTTKEKGSGLGLSIAKKIVNAHGGVIIAVSKLGKGTTFKIYIPIPHDENG